MENTDLLVERLDEAGVYLTDNIHEAMYILADGRLISGNYDMGMRGDDHRAIFSGVDYGDMYESDNPSVTHWDRLHNEYSLVRLVPENNLALIKIDQELTEDQIRILDGTEYEIERY